ncbi:transglycosylase domain-containing protein [Sphingobacterium sp. SYP-B4668]|uniref:transglycosylase domain-containing protein n=1 Tax=Sphingobacterium sp. SYP-B4668 TaxID=2996035 RepID=UPI0022DDA311|nr:transglycosylase domain-containing protein [Sphingobacterium sp. SYP-B4668]
MLKKFYNKITIKQKRWIIGTIAVVVLICGIGLLYGLSKRDAILQRAIASAKQKAESQYNVDLKIQYYGFRGLSTVVFKNVFVTPKGKDQLAQIDDFAVSVRLWPLLFGDVKIGLIEMENARFTLVKRDSVVNNYDFLFKKNKQDSTPTPKAEKNLAALADGLLKKVFFKIPRNMDVRNFEISFKDDSTYQQLKVPRAEIAGGDIDAALYLNGDEGRWHVMGHVNPDAQELNLKLASEKKNTEFPFLRSKFGIRMSFDEIQFDLQKVNRKGKELLTLRGDWQFKNLNVHHWRLSDQDINIPEATLEGGVDIGAQSIELVKESKVKVKDFEFSPQAKYVHKPEKIVALSIHTGRFEAQKLFDAIPKGLFESLEGVQVQGNIQYDLDFEVNLKKPDQLTFVSKIDDQELKVQKWGKADINKLNGPFVYTAYEGDKVMREITVGPQNPNFATYDRISNYMRTTLLNTEDPFFFKHNGFQEEAFKLSIVTNIKERKFKRGASTISMQLVKNVFLNRNKTLVRKLEEIMLVWLMESSKQVSKQRMYEVYLNVIEWGNNVYGITEAARYYFGKTPAEITLGESLFLSSIVPKPKKGLYSFEYTGHLKENVYRYFSTYGNIMVKTGQLARDTTVANYGFYTVSLQPNLRPHRPAGLEVDSLQGLDVDIDAEQEDKIRELELQEKEKRGLFDKIFDKKPPVER